MNGRCATWKRRSSVWIAVQANDRCWPTSACRRSAARDPLRTLDQAPSNRQLSERSGHSFESVGASSADDATEHNPRDMPHVRGAAYKPATGTASLKQRDELPIVALRCPPVTTRFRQ
jgi:hypothetical protein